MARIDELISKIEDIELQNKIQIEIKKLGQRKKFGLVFEEHVPEFTVLYNSPITVGTTVKLNKNNQQDLFKVVRIEEDILWCQPKYKSGDYIVELNFNDVVAVAEFGEPIYPYLEELDFVNNAEESDLWHILIQSDNYHALQLLEYLYAEKLDCIYIDPPYNTGDKQWKYNNNYVDSNDGYKHSKWLSFIKKRIEIAKKLLNPKNSVLIITIDEKEYLHLGMLLEDLFPHSKIQMISNIINPKGVARDYGFSRVEEYIYFVFIGEAKIFPNEKRMLNLDDGKAKKVRWASLQRSGSNSRRYESPSLFYPIFFNLHDHSFHSTGTSLGIDADKNDVVPPEGTYAVFPLGRNNDERTWQLSQNTLKERMSKGYVNFGTWNERTKKRTINYLSTGIIKKIEENEIKILGYDSNGVAILNEISETKPMSVWNLPSHSASEYGSTLLNKIMPDRKFPYPKSLYAVMDTLRFIVGKNPNAIVLDFFAGSGTTLHAINLLNEIYSTNIKCILVTNNEVAEREAKELRKIGSKPGSEEWERLGIARYITWPRLKCFINGKDLNDNEIYGTYYGTDLEMKDGLTSNVVFYKLGFLDKTSVALGQQLEKLISILWMKAGSKGKCPKVEISKSTNYLIFPQNGMGILVNKAYYKDFKEKLLENSDIETIYIVSNSEIGYQEMVKDLEGFQVFQLYRDYLENFQINTRRN